MQRLVHTVTMLAVLAHMVFGCCVHHAHADQPLGPEPPALATPASHHHHDSNGHDGPCCPGDKHPQGTGCDEGQCAFIVPSTPAGGTLSLDHHFQALSVLDSATIDSRYSHPAPADDSIPDPPPMPTRAHVLNQVFLL